MCLQVLVLSLTIHGCSWSAFIRRITIFAMSTRKKVTDLFGGSGHAGLIKGMRNWVLHRDILPLKFTIGLFTDRSQAVMLDIEQLNSFDGWDLRARALLAAHESDIRVLPLMQEYHDQV